MNVRTHDQEHDDVIKWKQFPRYWPFVRGIHRSPVNSPLKGQWLGALIFSLICTRINDWVNNGEAGDLRRYRVHYDVTVMNHRPWKPQLDTQNRHSHIGGDSGRRISQYEQNIWCRVGCETAKRYRYCWLMALISDNVNSGAICHYLALSSCMPRYFWRSFC